MGTSDDVLLAWFGDLARDRDDLERDMRRWQAGGEAEAARLAGFRPDVERALRGDLDAWADTGRGRVALVLLDQLTRTTYAGTAQAFAGDAKAIPLAREASDRGLPMLPSKPRRRGPTRIFDISVEPRGGAGGRSFRRPRGLTADSDYGSNVPTSSRPPHPLRG
jgi:uncharacterized protein (DUF924 family)